MVYSQTSMRNTSLAELGLATSGVDDGGRGAIVPGRLNVKTRPHFAYISVLALFWISVGCCFLRFSENFW